MKKIIFSVFLFFIVGVFSLSSIQAEEISYANGVFEGQHSFVKVRVVIDKGQIANIEIVEHGGGGKTYEDMIQPLIAQVIEDQDTECDAITGATVSSVNFQKAIEDALQKAVHK